MTHTERTRALRAIAGDLDRIDVEVYEQAGRDPLEPILGHGDPTASVCFFGRDPGRTEVEHARPFVGAGGQKVRDGLCRALRGADCPDFETSLEVGERVFWANTVPYKPVGNKVWPMRTRRACRPLVADLLVNHWEGEDVVCLGRVAFDWFGLDDRSVRDALKAFWSRDDRYAASIDVPLVAPDGAEKRVCLHPLPHPSPLNATWYKRFAGLLDDRLARLGIGSDGESV